MKIYAETEFENMTGIFIPGDFYDSIEKEYLEFDGDKQAFCKAFKENANGLAEKILFRFALEQEKKRLTVEKQMEDLKEQIQQLEAALEREQEWKPYENKFNVSQDAYEGLRMMIGKGGRLLSDDEAKDILYKRVGFAKDMVKILHALPVYEINRHRKLREVGKVERDPLYFASDYYYICFECAGATYENRNGNLNII